MVKKLIKRYFESFAYFYSHLGYRLFVVFGLNLLVGILDSLGLTMFLPLLQLVNENSEVDPDSLGKLSFLIEFIKNTGVGLNIFSVLLFMLFFFLAKGVVQYFGGIYKVDVQQWFVTRLRLRSIHGLNNLSYNHFVKTDSGRIQNTLTGEVGRVAHSYGAYFRAFKNGIMVFVYMAFAFSIDVQFALLVTVGGLLTNFLYKGLYKKTKEYSRKFTADSSRFQGLIIQNVTNFKYLKATGSSSNYARKLKKMIKQIESSNKKIGKLDALLTAAKEPILVLVVVVVIYIQTGLLGSPLGPILISLVFFYRALIFLMQMQVEWNRFLSVSGSLENFSKFEKELLKNREITGRTTINEDVCELELKNVSFKYHETPILKDITFNVNKQETLAFVGESGSGKTTLVNILAGLLPVESGEFKINGLNSSEIDIVNFQKRIGYITQDAVIFNDTVYNNVTFWAERTQENLQKFWNSLEKAAIKNFVNSLPEKDNELLGNNGVNLSGGQKQRISIARELFKQTEILILDEATSALDSETERIIQENIEQLKGKYTILIVAHRIATIKNADRIVVMKDGRISSINNFEGLIKESSYFKSLVELQEI
jgi:ABC-type multidrug transport system fused ATPase/permease subunit